MNNHFENYITIVKKSWGGRYRNIPFKIVQSSYYSAPEKPWYCFYLDIEMDSCQDFDSLISDPHGYGEGTPLIKLDGHGNISYHTHEMNSRYFDGNLYITIGYDYTGLIDKNKVYTHETIMNDVKKAIDSGFKQNIFLEKEIEDEDNVYYIKTSSKI